MKDKTVSLLDAFLAKVREAFEDILGKDLLEITDFSITSWLAFGAGLQLLSQLWLPASVSYWLPVAFLLSRLAISLFNCTRVFTGTFTDVRLGRWSTALPEPGESALTETNDGVVMFLLIARINQEVLCRFANDNVLTDFSPLGKLAPGVVDIDGMFQNMWKEAEKNRDKWSYLGRSATLFDITDGEGITNYWLSYWKDLKGLQEFSNSAVHRIGQKAYHKGKIPYVGIAHETFHAPKGHWECIYDNIPPVGMGQTQPVLSKDADGYKFAEALVKDLPISTMFSRMGRGLPRKGPLIAELK